MRLGVCAVTSQKVTAVPLPDDVRQERNLAALLNSVSEIFPERDTQLAAGLFETGEGVTTSLSQVAAGAAAHLAPFDVDPRRRSGGVEWGLACPAQRWGRNVLAWYCNRIGGSCVDRPAVTY